MTQMYTEEYLLDRIKIALRFGWYSCMDSLEHDDSLSLEEAETHYLDLISTRLRMTELDLWESK